MSQTTLPRVRRSPLLSVPLALALAACGGGSGSSGSGTGSLTLGITDGPVDEADKVVVEFSGVTLKPADGERIEIDFVDGVGDPAPKQWDLLQLAGDESQFLLNNEVVPAGRYEWIRLKINADENDENTEEAEDTYIKIGDDIHDLVIPSGLQTGLKLVRGFHVPVDGSASFTVDFDLRRSVIEAPPGEYKLKPTLRIVDNNDVGHLEGTVSGTFVTNECPNGDADGLAVYVFSGGGVTPDDVDGNAPDPITTALVEDPDMDGTYEFEVGFLSAGTYTLAFTCEAANDTSPELDEEIDFAATVDVNIEAGETTEQNFPVD